MYRQQGNRNQKHRKYDIPQMPEVSTDKYRQGYRMKFGLIGWSYKGNIFILRCSGGFDRLDGSRCR